MIAEGWWGSQEQDLCFSAVSGTSIGIGHLMKWYPVVVIAWGKIAGTTLPALEIVCKKTYIHQLSLSSWLRQQQQQVLSTETSHGTSNVSCVLRVLFHLCFLLLWKFQLLHSRECISQYPETKCSTADQVWFVWSPPWNQECFWICRSYKAQWNVRHGFWQSLKRFVYTEVPTEVFP